MTNSLDWRIRQAVSHLSGDQRETAKLTLRQYPHLVSTVLRKRFKRRMHRKDK